MATLNAHSTQPKLQLNIPWDTVPAQRIYSALLWNAHLLQAPRQEPRLLPKPHHLLQCQEGVVGALAQPEKSLSGLRYQWLSSLSPLSLDSGCGTVAPPAESQKALSRYRWRTKGRLPRTLIRKILKPPTGASRKVMIVNLIHQNKRFPNWGRRINGNHIRRDPVTLTLCRGTLQATLQQCQPNCPIIRCAVKKNRRRYNKDRRSYQ